MEVNHSMLLSCKTLERGKVLPAAKHNLRVITGPHIDSSRSETNVILAGPESAAEIPALAEQKMLATGLDLDKQRRRKNGTLAGEILFGLPASTPVDTLAYFRACVAWVTTTFGSEVTLSAVVHNDESNPHCHVLMLPMRRGRWLASKVFGKKGDLVELQADFFRAVASRFGLRESAVRLSAADKTALAASVKSHLKDRGDPVMRSETWPVVRAAVEGNPRPWAEQLGIPIPNGGSGKRRRTMVEIFTSSGKGPRKEKSSIDDLGLRAENCLPSVLADFLDATSDEPIFATDAAMSELPAERASTMSTAGQDGEPSMPAAVAVQNAGSAAVSTKGPASGCQSVATGKPISTAATDLRDASAAVIPEPLQSPLHGAAALLPPKGAAGSMTVPAALRERATGLPGRSTDRLGLRTLRDRRRNLAAPLDAGNDQPPIETTTRHRETEEAAADWDSDRGDFAPIRRLSSQGPAVRTSAGVRVREEEMPAEAWDSALGEHVQATRVMESACRLVPA